LARGKGGGLRIGWHLGLPDFGFWAPTRDFMHVVYGLSFFATVLLVLLLLKPTFNQYGAWFTWVTLLYTGYAALSTMWSEAPRLEFFAQHFLFLAVWLIGTACLAVTAGPTRVFLAGVQVADLYRVVIISKVGDWALRDDTALA
jgi:hypothetical protein